MEKVLRNALKNTKNKKMKNQCKMSKILQIFKINLIYLKNRQIKNPKKI